MIFETVPSLRGKERWSSRTVDALQRVHALFPGLAQRVEQAAQVRRFAARDGPRTLQNHRLGRDGDAVKRRQLLLECFPGSPAAQGVVASATRMAN